MIVAGCRAPSYGKAGRYAISVNSWKLRLPYPASCRIDG